VAPGAYTGAERRGREGKFKLADGGTLLLDEIGDMPLGLQAKLLRALQESEVEPLGSNRLEHVDVRVIAATSRDLGALVREGRFREDLYYRLNVLPLRVPPLRERASDIPALLEVLTEELALRNGLPHPEFTPQATALLSAQHWRGNVRELRNIIEQLLLRGEGGVIDDESVAQVLQASGLSQIAAPVQTPLAAASARSTDVQGLLRPLVEQVRELEVQAIAAALKATAGNKVAASKLLGMSRAKLYQRLV
jgi:transcriptional regulator with GAF, ATPase, and Fis domain